MIRRKILYLICLLTAIGLNIFYYEYQVFLLLQLIIIIPFCSWVLYIISRLSLKLSLSVNKSNVIVGDKISVMLTGKRRLNLRLARECARISYHYSEDSKHFEKEVYLREGMGKNAGSLDIETNHIGYIYINVSCVEIYDYFKLFHTRKKFEGTIRVCVLPNIVEYDEELIDGIANSIDSNANSIQKGVSDEILDLREFRDGDSVRQIHWKRSSALSEDDFVVKEFLNESDIIVDIIVDLGSYKCDDFRESLDEVYADALSCGMEYAKGKVFSAFVVWKKDKEDIAFFEFADELGCIEAFKHMLRIPCSENALDKATAVLNSITNASNGDYTFIENRNRS